MVISEKNTERNILLIDCLDAKGLVPKATNVIFKHGLNIERNQEFVDQADEHFFMRSEIVGTADRELLLADLAEAMPQDANIRLKEKRKKRIVILATKEYHCLGDLLTRHQFGDLNAEILAVVSNHEHLRDYCEKFGIPYHYVPTQGIGREEHERAVLDTLEAYDFEYLVLAKYMRILSSEFIRHFEHRIVNIHHSFLPAFIGANPYRQAYDRGVKIIGATAHIVTDDLDEGPIIYQDVTPVDHSFSPKEMARAGRDVEKIVLAKALKIVFEDRCFISGNKTIIMR
ncbi:formyltetrahydrofolate deformylase [Fulvitalea axinellae]|uniref:Formyltetrahydrofolate deformylase n=1 Tax=Fulvitalea axinellae TaxID=1182444 RepID=A0AAU9CKE4_9BACT|nr:formyltetrahydrofolate deformylase [Fulvitalea axinellae]